MRIRWHQNKTTGKGFISEERMEATCDNNKTKRGFYRNKTMPKLNQRVNYICWLPNKTIKRIILVSKDNQMVEAIKIICWQNQEAVTVIPTL